MHVSQTDFMVSTLFNSVLFLSNGFKFNEFACLRPPIYLSLLKFIFSFFFFFFSFLEKFDRPFYNIHKSNFLLQVTRFCL